MPAMIDATHRMLSDTAPPRRGDGRGGRRHVRRRRQDAHRLPDPRFGDRRVNLPLPYSYSNDSHRLLAVGASGRSYDANGNTTRRDLTSRSDATLGYDERNRLVSVASSGGTTRYRHNARGERVYKQVFGKTRRYAYDAAGRILVEDASAAGGQVQEFLWLDDLPVGLLNGTNLYPIQPDHLGSPRKISSGSVGASTLLWSWPILDNPFGETGPGDKTQANKSLAFGTSLTVNLRFPGQQYDPETGLHYNYFRDYEPGVGRYVESDPIGLRGGITTYAYVNGNSLKYVDRKGLEGYGSWTNPQYIPPPGGGDTGFYGADAHFFLGGGLTSVTCTDECGEKQTFRYLKTCIGAAAGGGASVGVVSNLSGERCRSDNYSGWFFEAGGCYGPACGGVDIGYTSSGGLSGVNEAGVGPGVGAEFKATWCYYWPLQ